MMMRVGGVMTRGRGACGPLGEGDAEAHEDGALGPQARGPAEGGEELPDGHARVRHEHQPPAPPTPAAHTLSPPPRPIARTLARSFSPCPCLFSLSRPPPLSLPRSSLVARRSSLVARRSISLPRARAGPGPVRVARTSSTRTGSSFPGRPESQSPPAGCASPAQPAAARGRAQPAGTCTLDAAAGRGRQAGPPGVL